MIHYDAKIDITFLRKLSNQTINNCSVFLLQTVLLINQIHYNYEKSFTILRDDYIPIFFM